MTATSSSMPPFPKLWSRCLVEQAGETILGQTKRTVSAEGQPCQYLRVANVQDGTLDLSDLLEMPFLDPPRYELKADDILLCEGQSKELVGRAAPYLGEPTPLYFQNALLRFRAFHGVDPKYALLVFRSYQKNGVFSAVSKATTNIAHLGRTRFTALEFPLPPHAVQQEIALRAQAFQDSIDLVHESIEACRVQLDPVVREARDIEILGPSGKTWSDSRVGESPWPVRILSDLVPEDAPISYGINQPGPEDPDGIPYIRGQDLQEGFILEDQLRKTSRSVAERHARSTLATGDVLLGIIRQTRVAIVPPSLAGGNITQGTVRIRPRDGLHPPYLAHWISSGIAQNWLHSKMRGIDMPGLNVRDVRLLPVPVPEYEEQVRIAEKLDAITWRAQDLRTSITGLLDNIPHLESELLASFAYGEQAIAIADEISGPVQVALSEELAETLAAAERQTRAAADTERHEKRRQRTASASSEMTRTSEERTFTDGAKVLRALQSLPSPCSPEVLFSSLKLDASAVDSFYAALRKLRNDEKILVSRSEEAEATIRLVRNDETSTT